MGKATVWACSELINEATPEDWSTLTRKAPRSQHRCRLLWMSRFLGWKTPTSAHEYNISTLWKDRYHDQANKPTARNCSTEERKLLGFLFGRLFGWPGSYDLVLNEYLKTQSWSGEWILDEERGARHCEDALSGLPSQHKRLCTQRSPKMTSFQEGGYLSLFMEKETSVLCSSNNLATSPPSVKSSRNPLFPYIPPSSHPLPRPPPLTPTHQFLWWQAPGPIGTRGQGT